jgi:hypothetical protein
MPLSILKHRALWLKYIPMDPMKYGPLLQIKSLSYLSSNIKTKKKLTKKRRRNLALDEGFPVFLTPYSHGPRRGKYAYEFADNSILFKSKGNIYGRGSMNQDLWDLVQFLDKFRRGVLLSIFSPKRRMHKMIV